MLAPILLLLLPLAAERVDDAYQAIRSNNTAQLKQLLAGGLDKNARDKRGVPLLMHAATVGSAASIRMLLDAGADPNLATPLDATALMWGMSDKERTRMLVAAGANVNARSKLGKTPLLIAAAHNGYADILHLLISKGADVKAVDERGGNALIVAAGAADAESVRLLLARGLDANSKDKGGNTALQAAAASGNLAIVKMLLAAHADVNAANQFSGEVKKGKIALTKLSPLHLAVNHGSPEIARKVRSSGEAGRPGTDVRGMTPLMLSAATDFQSPAVMKVLLAKGADPAVKSATGETTFDWAGKFRNPEVDAMLKSQPSGAKSTKPAATRPAQNASEAVDRSLALLTSSSTKFFAESGCMGCHHQSITVLAGEEAKARSITTHREALGGISKVVRFSLPQFAEMMLQRFDIPAGPDIVNHTTLALAAEGYPADSMTDVAAIYTAALQYADGNWNDGGISRPPVEDGSVSSTALAIQTLKVYAPPARRAEFDKKIAHAAAWLRKHQPRSTEERAMQLLGLHWAGAPKQELVTLGGALTKLQRQDGGWAATAHLDSDAYATGLTLWTLQKTGAETAASPAWQKGAAYLLATQKDDGSWFVASRAPKFQPYFESGFPYGHDQWLSAFGTGWATAALAASLPKR